MKRAVITILGAIGVPREGQERAKYYFSDALKDTFLLKRENYTNMLPLLVDNFEEEIVSIYTQTSKARQEEVLAYEELVYDIEKNGFFVSEKSQDVEADYGYLLNGINTIMERYDSVIIDMSHGFRHFPILAIINLIIQNIKNPKKVEFILFAKEIVPFKEYEIIDLKEYLELANLSFMLSTFNQNYTVSSNIEFTNPLYKRISEELSEFSSHFLSNSLKSLIEGNIIENIIDNLESLQTKRSVENFNNYITEIIEHLEDIRQLKYEKSDWMRLYKLSKAMDERGYQLNAITLLFEAVGFYCLEKFSQIDTINKQRVKFLKDIESKRKPRHLYSFYTMTNQTRTLIKTKNRFKIDKPLFITQEVKETIIDYINDVEQINEFKDFIEGLERLRNNVAHGNISQSLEDVKGIYNNYMKEFKKFCMNDNDIFKSAKYFKPKNSVDRLKARGFNSKWN